MSSPQRRYRSTPVQVAALVVLVALGLGARVPAPSRDEVGRLAEHFRFTRTPLTVGDQQLRYTVFDVNPTVAHLRHYLSLLSSSIALADLDEDGLPNDVCHVENRNKAVILSPAPGTGERYTPFTLTPPPSIDLSRSYPSKCHVGDFNEDGLADLMVSYAGAWPIVYLRRTAENGDYSHPLATEFAAREIALDGRHWMTIAAVTADVDGDGHGDIVIGNYFPDGSAIYDTERPAPVAMNDSFSAARNGGTDRILLWESASAGREPQVRFRETPDPFPGDDEDGWTLAVGAADLDRDGLVDLYLAHDFGPDVLYANRSTPGQVRLVRLTGKQGFFTPKSRVMGHDSFKSMGIDFADINGDGYFDMFVSNIASPWAVQESHFLWVSTGEVDRMDAGVAPYHDLGEEMGVAHSSWGWDSRFADFDNDGVQEAIQATGFKKGTIDRWPNLGELAITNDRLAHDPAVWPKIDANADVNGHDPNPLYVRGSDGRFVDVTSVVDLGGPWNTRGIAIGDVDGDGDLDFIFGNVWEDSQFYRNDAPRPGRFVSLHVLRPTAGARRDVSSIGPGHPQRPEDGWPAWGAWAMLHLPDGSTRVGQVDGGSGHTGAPSPELHFGIGDLPAETPLTLDLTWRDDRGTVRRDHFTVTPGWHTIRLASGGI
jgi:hypothetical protein